jgi:putative hydrolase of the HAD superfamily
MAEALHTSPIEAVIFDLGRVLIRVDFARGLFRRYPAAADTNDLSLLEHLMNDPVFREFTCGNLTPEELYRTVSAKYQLNLSFDEFVREWCNIFDIMEGMDEVVQHVAQRYPVGLLSDIDPLHWDYCRQNFVALKHFPDPALSFEIRAMKPDEICYRTAAVKTGKPVQNCLFIDDRPINVEGAIRAGMQAVQFLNKDQLVSELIKLNVW